jgi:hypothetical protein
VVAVVLLAGCAGTTVVEDQTTVPASTTAPTVPPGGLEVLLPALLDTLAGMSEDLAAKGSAPERARLAYAEELWAAAEPLVEAERPELVDQFDQLMALVTTAVDRRRPADADKAFAFMTPLVDEVLPPTTS